MGFAAMLAEARPNSPFGTGGNKSQQKNLISTQVFLLGFCSGLKDHRISAQQKALNISGNT
jgi:hypothetical protein